MAQKLHFAKSVLHSIPPWELLCSQHYLHALHGTRLFRKLPVLNLQGFVLLCEEGTEKDIWSRRWRLLTPYATLKASRDSNHAFPYLLYPLCVFQYYLGFFDLFNSFICHCCSYWELYGACCSSRVHQGAVSGKTPSMKQPMKGDLNPKGICLVECSLLHSYYGGHTIDAITTFRHNICCFFPHLGDNHLKRFFGSHAP